MRTTFDDDTITVPWASKTDDEVVAELAKAHDEHHGPTRGALPNDAAVRRLLAP
jgi:hypothetical protein